jgi:hypothetical protein
MSMKGLENLSVTFLCSLNTSVSFRLLWILLSVNAAAFPCDLQARPLSVQGARGFGEPYDSNHTLRSAKFGENTFISSSNATGTYTWPMAASLASTQPYPTLLKLRSVIKGMALFII